ncbi:MAG: PLP-dependent cysteine synthase family protein [Candidatus Paceibacterota bacterium]
MIHNDILSLVGHTPLVKINRIVGADDAEIFVKLEKMNIGGSVKDRLAMYLIQDAERKNGDIKNRTLIEASSGSTGISLAMIAAVKGYALTIVMPESVSIERRKLIKAYGAELILSDGSKGTGGAIELKSKIVADNPQQFIPLDQHSNPANVLSHFETTAEEILEDIGEKVDMMIFAIGTGGTAIGISKKMKAFNPEIKVVGVTPKVGVSIQGIRNPMEKNGSEVFDESYFDEIVEMDESGVKKSYEFSRRLAKEEGILSGMSSGAAMCVAVDKAKILGKGKTIVTLLADSGERYLSTNLFE